MQSAAGSFDGGRGGGAVDGGYVEDAFPWSIEPPSGQGALCGKGHTCVIIDRDT